MWRRAGLSVVLIACWSASGQTNTPVAPLGLLRLSQTELLLGTPNGRASGPRGQVESKEPSPTAASTNNLLSLSPKAGAATNQVATELVLNSWETDFDAQLYRRLEQGGYLMRPEAPSDNLLDRAVDGIFRPEVVRFRKVDVSCSIITALKRKNPLCLLNPIFFSASW